MNTRRLHRLLGIVMLLPLLAWVATGAIFFIKPGYAGAYDMLSVRTLPLTAVRPVTLPPATLEARSMRTVLGEHLLVRGEDGWAHYDPATMRSRAAPSSAEVRALVAAAIAGKPRYGELATVSDLTAKTTTGVTITLDWPTLSLQQRGPDTDRIDRFYRIHYLQWTGIRNVDRVLDGVGLLTLLLLTLFGLRLVFRRRV